MSEQLKPGLYRATVRGAPDVIVAVGDDSYGRTMESFYDYYSHDTNHITDARPLIVLDLSGFISDAVLVADLRAPHVWGLGEIADQIEAQTKPARIPEPTLWGVVEATYSGWHRGQWVHCDGDVWRSLRDDGHEWVAWTSLVDPILIREGSTNSE